MIGQEKVEKLQAIMQKKEIDAVILIHYVDILYFTGTIQANLLLILKQGAPLIFARRGIDRIKPEVEYGELKKFSSYKEIKEFLPSDFKRIGFAFDVTPVNLFQKISSDLDIKTEKIIDISNDFRSLKMVKNKAEIDKIRRAGEILKSSYEQVVRNIKIGMSESEVASEVEYYLKKNGHLGENRFRAYNQIGLLSYVISGDNIFKPTIYDTPYGGEGIHKAMGLGASTRIIRKNEPFIIDSVANFEGYHNDCTRTFVFSEPDKSVEDYYKKLLEIYHYILSLLKPGVLCEEVYQKALEKAASMGYEQNFMGLEENRVPFIGHGIGIQVDEFPVLAKNFKIALEPGMTIALEPKLFFREFGGVGIETTLVITETGCELLCKLSEDLKKL